MKPCLIAALALLLTLPTVVGAEGSKDAVAVDPTHHHVILDNDHVRIFKVLAAPGASSPMHTHPPLVAVSLDRARLTMRGPDGEPFTFDLDPAQVLWMEDVEHDWNLLSGQVNIVAVEIKAARGGEAPTPAALGSKDAVAVDPTHHHVVFENDHVRVWEALVSPGAKSPLHTHPPMALISLGKARMSMSGPDGSPSIFDLNPGQVLWLEEGLEHSWELLSGQAHVIAVEVKAARPEN